MNWNKINRWLTVLCYITIAAVLFLGLVGCATDTIVSQSDIRNKQAAYEGKIRRCTNSGGVWYHFGNTRGKCDYYPLDR